MKFSKDSVKFLVGCRQDSLKFPEGFMKIAEGFMTFPEGFVKILEDPTKVPEFSTKIHTVGGREVQVTNRSNLSPKSKQCDRFQSKAI